MSIERAGLLALLIVAGGFASCAATAPGQSESPTKVSAAPSDVEALALKTLSDHLSRPANEIEVVSTTPMNWPDSSLGCPKPDRGYTQAIRPGHLAVLRHGTRTYRVHIANGRAFVCEQAAGKSFEESRPIAPLAIPLEHLKTLARMDLAQRLSVPVEQVSVAGSRPVVWPDASLGCPDVQQSYEPARTKGHIFELVYRGRAYTYHADQRRVLPCPAIERG